MQIEIDLKYEGYILKQQKRNEQVNRLQRIKLPSWIDYFKIEGLKKEAMQKLNEIRPVNLKEAGSIYGVNPADIAVLLIWLKKQSMMNREEIEEMKKG